jgi:hypothetical protein
MHVWALTGPVSDLSTENNRNGDLVPVRGQESGPNLELHKGTAT